MIVLICKGLVFGLVLFLFSQFAMLGPSEAFTGCAFSAFVGCILKYV